MAQDKQLISAEEAYGLAQLHAKMMLAFESINWSIGQVRDIWIGTRAIRRKERRERGITDKTEKVYITEHTIRAFPSILFTRSGAVYRGTMVGSPSGLVTSGPEELVTFATLASRDAYDFESAMNNAIEHCEGERLQSTVEAFLNRLP